MKVTSNTMRPYLPESNQAFKQGQKVKDVGQKSAKESESENISQDWVNQHFRRKYRSKLGQSTFSPKSLD
jgi:hypothetical protein